MTPADPLAIFALVRLAEKGMGQKAENPAADDRILCFLAHPFFAKTMEKVGK